MRGDRVSENASTRALTIRIPETLVKQSFDTRTVAADEGIEQDLIGRDFS
jgi:hypothetical protein